VVEVEGIVVSEVVGAGVDVVVVDSVVVVVEVGFGVGVAVRVGAVGDGFGLGVGEVEVGVGVGVDVGVGPAILLLLLAGVFELTVVPAGVAEIFLSGFDPAVVADRPESAVVEGALDGAEGLAAKLAA